MSALSCQRAEAEHCTLAGAPAAQLDAWLAPICVDAPAGTDTSYHDAQLRIRHELDKLQSLTGQLPSWQLVFAESDRLLRTETKDLSLAGFLTVALFELHGLCGLLLGLRAITGVAERFWELCWPPHARVKQRANTLQWVIGQLHVSASLRAWTPADLSALPEVQRAYADFARHMQQRFGPTTLDLEPLQALIERVRVGAAPAADAFGGAPPQESARASSAVPPPAASRVSALPAVARAAPAAHVSAHGSRLLAPTACPSLASEGESAAATQPGDTVAHVHALASSVIELAQAHFHADRTDPRAYRWLRAGLWLPWDHVPTVGVRGRTEIAPPNRKLYQALHATLREQCWETALEQSEQLCRHHPFWLEGHWLSANTLEKLGEAYRPAKAAVEFEVRAFTQRLPRLCALQFSDGSPVCPPGVSVWLAGLGASQATTRAPEQNARTGLNDDLRRAVVEGEAAGLATLRALLDAAGDQRARFFLTVEVAQALHAAGRLERALVLYLALEREVEDRQLWRWEPECCIQVLRALVTLMTACSPRGVVPSSDGEMRRVRVKLAQLDPASL